MADVKRKGGYYLADFDGAAIGVAGTQTFANRVYDGIADAIKHNKPIIVENLKMKAGNIYYTLSPINVSFFDNGENVVGMCSVYSIVLTKGESADTAIISLFN